MRCEEMEEQIKQIHMEFPYKLVVKKTGEADPTKETFKFVIEDFGTPVEYKIISDAIETNGEKTYNGTFAFTINSNLLGNISEGFVLRQIKGNAGGWTYDETSYYVRPYIKENVVEDWAFYKLDKDGFINEEDEVREAVFTNSYNAKKAVTPVQKNDQDNKMKSPKTGNDRKKKKFLRGENNMKKFLLVFCLMILQAGLLCGCRLPHKDSPQKPVEGKNKSGLVKVQDDKKEEKKEEKEKEKEEPGKTEIVETEDTELAFLRKQINQNGCSAGVALFGYVDSEFTMTDLSFYLEFHHLTKEYPFLSEAACYMADGQELYAIVPPNEKGRVTVYPSDITENGEYADDKSHPLFEGKPGEVLVLRCNFSEIYSNVLVSVTDGGDAIEFHPSISLMDGHLAELAGVYDFSVYEETPDERSVEIATEILLEYGEVRQGLENGMKLMYTGESEIINGGSCMLFVLGTDNGEQFVQEQLYGVCDNLIYIYDVFTDTWNAAY